MADRLINPLWTVWVQDFTGWLQEICYYVKMKLGAEVHQCERFLFVYYVGSYRLSCKYSAYTVKLCIPVLLSS